MFLKKGYGGASLGSGPAPIVWNNIPVGLDVVDPDRAFGFFTRFIGADGLADDATSTAVNGWITDYVANAGTVVPANAVGGGIILTPDTAENDGMQIQKGEAFKPAAGKYIAFGARVAFADADQLDAFIGLATLDSDLAQSNPNDCIGFTVADGSANINYKVAKDGTGSATDSGEDLADATAVNLEVLVKETDSVELYVDGVKVATVTTNICDDEELGLGIAAVNGTTSANTCTVSWAYAYEWDKSR